MLDSVGADAFRPQYDYLSTASPEWGKTALLPWDEEIFAFATYSISLPVRHRLLNGMRRSAMDFARSLLYRHLAGSLL